MVQTLSRITTLLVAVAILLIGHGLQLTLLPVHAQAIGWSTSAIGVTGSFYFLGFVAGCILIPGVVAGVGHIRTFMVMAAIATAALLAAGVFVSVGSWIIFRFATGLALAGLYMVIESWLSDVSQSNQRGSVLAIYSMISLMGMALGQALLGLGEPLELQLFMLAAILMSIAIVPIGLMRVASPHPIPPVSFTPRIMLRTSRVAVVGALFAGLVTGAFWTLGPVVGRAFGLAPAEIGVMMSTGILGGAAAHLPVGRLSDRFDRRGVVGGLMLFGAGVAAFGMVFGPGSPAALFSAIFLFGASTMPIYSLCIAHASDNTELSLVEVASGILIMHSAGSIIGPIVVAALMDSFGARSFFAYVLACLVLASIWTLHRKLVVERPMPTHVSILPRTTHAVAELDPDEPTNAEPGPGEGIAPPAEDPQRS
jgi:MFS family permease